MGRILAITCPRNRGSLYYNYKGFHSIILFALVDANYKFMWVDMGVNGSSSDVQIFNQSQLGESIIDGTLQVPAAEPLPSNDHPMPYFLIGDDALLLCKWLMKPFIGLMLLDDQRIFNYRLSHVRRAVDNAFGILANIFGCLLTTMNQNKDTVTSIVLACCVLHNIMRIRYPGVHHGSVYDEDKHHRLVPRQWRQGVNLQDMEEVTAGTPKWLRNNDCTLNIITIHLWVQQHGKMI